MLIPTILTRDSMSPAATLNGVRGQLDRFLDDLSPATSAAWRLPTDIVETDEELRFTIDVPGVRPEDIEVTVSNGVLTVSGERGVERQEDAANGSYRLFERRYGRFSRSFRLPRTVDTNRVNASCDDGVLMIRVPRVEEAKARRIEVQSAQPRVTQAEPAETGRAA